MEYFQKLILIVAGLILIIILVFIGINLANMKSNLTWPPNIPQCPDYWELDVSGNDIVCKNVLNLGKCSSSTGSTNEVVNFSTSDFTGNNALCSKYTWAKNCGVSWDGITYGVDNPCSTTEPTT